MTAPSIKEALEPCPFCNSRRLECGGDDKFVGVRCLDCEATGPNHYITGKDWNTRATLQPSGERREAILKMLCCPKGCFREDDCLSDKVHASHFRRQQCAAILASGFVQDEAGIRADEREKCAKVIDVQFQWDDREEIAAAIRSARDGGAES